MADELMHVPTVAELVKQGLAKPAPAIGKQGSAYTLTPEGQRLILDAMAHNARIMRVDAERREQLRLAAERRATQRKVDIDDHAGQGWQHKG